METQFVDSETKIWKSPLIKLTLVCNPSVNGNKPTICYIDPQLITHIYAAESQFKDQCTVVAMCHGSMLVLESPNEVALLRDRMLGYEQKPKAVA